MGWIWQLPSTLDIPVFYYRTGLGHAELETINHHLSLPLHEPFTAQPQGLGVFANRPVSVLFAGVSPQAERALTYLHRYQGDYLGDFRHPDSARSYTPHIVLARGPRQHVAQALDIVDIHCADFWPEFEVTHLNLYQSENGRSKLINSHPLREVDFA